ncbi:hypothetical protein ACFZAR_01555 [Streptomyces sp. NPDC008222]|uniref:hypothetical protein n=1 Tax=Streptomyces sp. NPDC008222 TaxID=3364820 RepID=UPI0036E98425
MPPFLMSDHPDELAVHRPHARTHTAAPADDRPYRPCVLGAREHKTEGHCQEVGQRLGREQGETPRPLFLEIRGDVLPHHFPDHQETQQGEQDDGRGEKQRTSVYALLTVIQMT